MDEEGEELCVLLGAHGDEVGRGMPLDAMSRAVLARWRGTSSGIPLRTSLATRRVGTEQECPERGIRTCVKSASPGGRNHTRPGSAGPSPFQPLPRGRSPSPSPTNRG